MIQLRRVSGHSMEPILHNGQIIIVRRIQKPAVGDIVVAKVDGREVIKLVKEIKEAKENKESNKRRNKEQACPPSGGEQGTSLLAHWRGTGNNESSVYLAGSDRNHDIGWVSLGAVRSKVVFPKV